MATKAITDRRGVAAFCALSVFVAGAGPGGGLSVRESPDEGDGGVASAAGGSELRCPADVRYYHHDATGNLLALTDEAGTVAWRAEIHPFGLGVPNPASRPLEFVGEPRDGEIGLLGGLYHMGARSYDPITGRFLGVDPLPLAAVERENPQRFNRFVYALNNPYRYVDRTGRSPDEEKEKARTKTIKKVTDVVSSDDEFVKNTKSWLRHVPWGLSGSLRNLGYFLSGRDSGDPETAKEVCTGISEQAVKLINKAVKDGKLPGVEKATAIERVNQPGREDSWVYHTAVLVEMKDGSKVVLDWHATLDPKNPKVTTPEEF